MSVTERPGSIFQPLENDCFGFACHPRVACFNECCARLTLTLTPYDILRLKNRLGISSAGFLDEYTETGVEEKRRFPSVQLKMSDQEGRPCPFVSANGCTVYEDRPGACRIYPLGRGSARGGREIFFLVKEGHCRGFDEERNWTREEWMSDQGLTIYNRFNDMWMEIITSRASLGPPEQAMKKVQMFFMVSYNLDRFRDFVTRSGFLERFDIDAELIGMIRESDEALLELGFQWLKFSLFGEKTLAVRP